MTRQARAVAKLVARATTGQIAVLLDPERFASVTRGRGWSGPDLMRALREEGRLPEEILLDELEKGAQPTELLALAGEDAVATARRLDEEAAADEQGRSRTAPFENVLDAHTPSEKVGSVLLICAALLPALLLGDSPASRIASTLGGALGGALFVGERAPRWTGALCGGLASAGGFLAAHQWLSLRGGTVLQIELVVAIVLGVTPGASLFVWLFRRHARA